jgi:hypothetical protein
MMDTLGSGNGWGRKMNVLDLVMGRRKQDPFIRGDLEQAHRDECKRAALMAAAVDRRLELLEWSRGNQIFLSPERAGVTANLSGWWRRDDPSALARSLRKLRDDMNEKCTTQD